MARFCSNCGAMLGEKAAFCTECGTPAAAPSAPPVIAPAPDPYALPNGERTVEAAVMAEPLSDTGTESAPAPVPELSYDPAQEPIPELRYDPVVEQVPDLVYDPEPQALPEPSVTVQPTPEPAAQPTAQPTPEPAVQPAAQTVYPPAPQLVAPTWQSGQDPYGYPPRQPVTAQPAGVVPGPEQKPVSTIGFMLLQLLYSIPVVGFIASLVLAIAPENKNLKHHALASFLWKIIGLILLIVSIVLTVRVAEKVWQEIGSSYSYHWDAGDIDDLWDSLKDGDVSGILEQFREAQ